MSIFTQHGISLTTDQEAQFEELFELFSEWNQKINLSAIRDREGVYLKHFVDSLLVRKYVDFSGKKIADLGTGGGFPSLPIGIVAEGAEIHAFDSVGKKLKAVQDMADQLKLNVHTFHGRLEELGQSSVFRERYDLVTTRALAEWGTLLEYALPFVRVGGSLVAYQGPKISEQLTVNSEQLSHSPLNLRGDAEGRGDIIDFLGGEIVGVWEERLGEDERIIIEIKKIKPTPKKYPREVGVPKKDPLK